MQLAVANRAATDQRRQAAPESLTVRSKSFAHGAYASTIGGRLRTSSVNLAVLRLPT